MGLLPQINNYCMCPVPSHIPCPVSRVACPASRVPCPVCRVPSLRRANLNLNLQGRFDSVIHYDEATSALDVVTNQRLVLNLTGVSSLGEQFQKQQNPLFSTIHQYSKTAMYVFLQGLIEKRTLTGNLDTVVRVCFYKISTILNLI